MSLEPFGCPICGLLLRPGRCPNSWCHRSERAFSVVFPAGVYDRELRGALTRYKYRRERWLARVFAGALARVLDEHPTWFEEFDLVSGVPAYTGPGAARDWDHIGLILERFDELAGARWATRTGILSKSAETPRMQGQPWAERRRIAAGPLRRSLSVSDPAAVAGARILLVDDVLTEGSTLHEAARALRRAGAAEVAGLVLARPRWQIRGPSRSTTFVGGPTGPAQPRV